MSDELPLDGPPEAPAPSDPAADLAAEGNPALPVQSAAAPPPRPNPVVRFLKAQWAKLTKPTTKKPADYRGRRVARIVNEELDGRGNTGGPAHRAELGESVALPVEHLIHGGDATTPGGFLVASSLEYGWIMWDEEPQREAAAQQQLQPAGAQLAPPPPPPSVRVIKAADPNQSTPGKPGKAKKKAKGGE
jgi:hypothetical protein